MPALRGANILVPKANAEVLLKSESGDPILIAGRVGGRVLALAGDTTWRWVMHGREEQYKRFWRQIVLWLAAQDEREKNSVWIDLPQRRFQPNSFVSFSCLASDSVGALITDAQFVATLVKPDNTTTPISIDPVSNRGEIDRELLADPGLYKIQLSGSRNGKKIGDSKFEFILFDRDKEKAVPAADPELMARLADQTDKNGGRVVLPEDLGQLLKKLRDNPPEKIEVPLLWRLGETTADASGFLLAFVALLATEWMLRKKWGLV
jgi:hypothetical protein